MLTPQETVQFVWEDLPILAIAIVVTIYYNLFTTEEINSQDTNLSRTKDNFSLVKDENLENGKNEQREDVEQSIKHVNITGEIVIPAGGRMFIVITCTAV